VSKPLSAHHEDDLDSKLDFNKVTIREEELLNTATQPGN
jgi:hypothetical protein